MELKKDKTLKNWDIEGIDYTNNRYFLDKKKSKFFNKCYVTIVAIKNKKSGKSLLFEIEATEKNCNKVTYFTDNLLDKEKLNKLFDHLIIQKNKDKNLKNAYPETPSQLNENALNQIKKAVIRSILILEQNHQIKKEFEKIDAITSSIFEDKKLSNRSTSILKSALMYRTEDINKYHVIEIENHINRKSMKRINECSFKMSETTVSRDTAIQLVCNWNNLKELDNNYIFKKKESIVKHIDEAKAELDNKLKIRKLSKKGFGI